VSSDEKITNLTDFATTTLFAIYALNSKNYIKQLLTPNPATNASFYKYPPIDISLNEYITGWDARIYFNHLWIIDPRISTNTIQTAFDLLDVPLKYCYDNNIPVNGNLLHLAKLIMDLNTTFLEHVKIFYTKEYYKQGQIITLFDRETNECVRFLLPNNFISKLPINKSWEILPQLEKISEDSSESEILNYMTEEISCDDDNKVLKFFLKESEDASSLFEDKSVKEIIEKLNFTLVPVQEYLVRLAM